MSAAVVAELVQPDQIYVSLWSHAGGVPCHIHFVVQPITREQAMAMRGVTLLGSTGSIGTNALAVIEREPRRFRIVALTAHGRLEALLQQCLRHRPEFAVLSRDADAGR
mgnify:CR=1 FL=1